MDRLTRERIERIKRDYPEGTRVYLVRMDDVQAPPQGTAGTVLFTDDIGTVHVAWDNGSRLGAVIGEDIISKVPGTRLKEDISPFAD